MFDILISFFNIVLYQPLFNALILLYIYLPGHDFGIAVIVLTIIIRLLLYPSMAKSIKSQKVLAELQPKIQEIQKKYKENKEKQGRAMMELYKREKINPFGGCLPLLIQLPILIALYQVFWKGFQPEAMVHLYSFVPRLEMIDPNFLGIINLANASIVLALLAGITQFFQTKMMMPQVQKSQSKPGDFSQIMSKQMLYFFPVFTVFILWKLPAAIALYWFVTALFSIGQQRLILRSVKKEEYVE